MKHGEKAKSKASKASGKKSDKASSASKSSKASLKAHTPTSSAKAGTSSKGGNGAIRGRSTDPFNISNPVVAAAFKRAVKKYPNTFRRLTD
jgi:hypothetical protein